MVMGQELSGITAWIAALTLVAITVAAIALEFV
jgi:hypothetical protein